MIPPCRLPAALLLALLGTRAAAQSAPAPQTPAPPPFRKVMVIVLENASYAAALKQPELAAFARQGALLSDMYAEAHPSQPNYIALVAGRTDGVAGDKPVSLQERHLGDLLEARGLRWKVYAEGYPGGCFLGSRKGDYVRKHIPFLSFLDVQKDPQRCANIVNAAQLDADAAAGRMPDFSFYIPDLRNDGHETGVEFAGRWLERFTGPRLRDPAFMKDLLLVVTFDEDDFEGNQIYTALVGNGVRPGSVYNRPCSHYSLLRTFEEGLGLGTLGAGDAAAEPLRGVWR